MLPKGKARSRLSSTSATRTQEPVETGASSSGAAMAKQPVAAGGGSVSAFLKRGPPNIPRITEAPDQRKRPDESDQEHKCRLAGERYSSVVGETEEGMEMVEFFQQVLAADSRGVIRSFALSIIVSRYWGRDHIPNDTYLVTIAKTEKQLIQWVHPHHFAPFVAGQRIIMT